ncbi:MAG TPA: hypothetical protein EYM60_01640 [Candidatus Marinimicrobia bacterium]|nr:hypothetical protein [Candidatus Neomarinimicrobiota bacterium]
MLHHMIPSNPFTDICDILGVSKATLYRYLKK